MYYKVVNNQLKSIVHGRSDIAVQYIINEWVFPKIGNCLMCFSELKYAESWSKTYRGVIYECDVDLCPKPDFIRTGNLYSDSVKRKLEAINTLRLDGYIITPPKYNNPPEGTVFCSAIKLLRKCEV